MTSTLWRLTGGRNGPRLVPSSEVPGAAVLDRPTRATMARVIARLRRGEALHGADSEAARDTLHRLRRGALIDEPANAEALATLVHDFLRVAA